MLHITYIISRAIVNIRLIAISYYDIINRKGIDKASLIFCPSENGFVFIYFLSLVVYYTVYTFFYFPKLFTSATMLAVRAYSKVTELHSSF